MKNYEENFESWCEDCVKITDKLTGSIVPFRLNAPQKRLLREFERQRSKGEPIRVILLKARQWGGSTLVQTYMAWMQLVRHTGWNSLICAHVKDASGGIKGMYSTLLRNYPRHLTDDKEWKFQPYEKSQSVSYIPVRDCKVAIGSAQAPDALRGGNYHLAHLSEAAFWNAEGRYTASQVVRTVCGTVPPLPDTLIVVESTANGRGDYFHGEWQRAVEGKSDKVPIFVPWHEIEIYSRELASGEWDALLPELTEYELGLLKEGVARENVAWYHYKCREYQSHREMMAEFPTTPEEAFATSGSAAFAPEERPLSESDSEVSASLLVLAPGVSGSRHTIVTAGISPEGMLSILSDKAIPGSAPEMMEFVERKCRAEGLRLLIADTSPVGSMSHARWCARRSESAGIPLHIAGEDSAIFLFPPEELSEMTDHYRWLMSRGMVTDLCAGNLYDEFTLGNPYAHPGMLCRLAASSLLCPYQASAPARPEDFFSF